MGITCTGRSPVAGTASPNVRPPSSDRATNRPSPCPYATTTLSVSVAATATDRAPGNATRVKPGIAGVANASGGTAASPGTNAVADAAVATSAGGTERLAGASTLQPTTKARDAAGQQFAQTQRPRMSHSSMGYSGSPA